MQIELTTNDLDDMFPGMLDLYGENIPVDLKFGVT